MRTRSASPVRTSVAHAHYHHAVVYDERPMRFFPIMAAICWRDWTILLLAGVYETYWLQMAFNVAVIIVVLARGAIGAYRSEIASRLGRGCFQ
jgi:hypothetical protein